MLGRGCPWKGRCGVRADSFTKKNYCDSDSGCYKCPHRPMNSGNQKVQNDYKYSKSNHETTSFGQVICVGVIILIIIYFLFMR